MSDNNSKIRKMVEVVAAFVNENGRGMETFRLQAMGYSKSDIQDAIDANALESRRGRTGGIYIAGQVPEKQEVSTLKGEAFAVLRAILSGYDVTNPANFEVINALVERYDAECARRSEAKKKASSEAEDD